MITINGGWACGGRVDGDLIVIYVLLINRGRHTHTPNVNVPEVAISVL